MKTYKLNHFSIAILFCFALSMITFNINAGDVISQNDDINNYGFAKLNTNKTSASTISLFNYLRRSDYNSRLRSGVTFKLAAYIPSTDYFKTKNSNNSSKNFKTGFDLQFGTHIYIGPSIINMIRLGLDFSWIDFSLAIRDQQYFEDSYNLNFGFIGFGPIAAFSPNKLFALDAYFKLLPVVSYGFQYYDNNSTSNPILYSNDQLGFGMTKLIGIGFRFKALYVGLERNWGQVDYKSVDNDDDLDIYHYDCGKLLINNTRLFFGVKL